MKLRNKKTGEIVEYDIIEAGLKVNPVGGYIAADSLTEFCDEWEDVEEPKTHWMIDTSVLEPVREIAGNPYEIDKEIGNWFSTKEEAELAVRKLKAWKRLKDFGCRLVLDDHFDVKFVGPDATKITSAEEQKSLIADYKLLFGGEE